MAPLLLALLLASPAAAWKIGVSLSLTGTYEADFTRGYLAEVQEPLSKGNQASIVSRAKRSLDLWLEKANEKGSAKGWTFTAEVLDDGSEREQMRANYVQLAQDASIDVLLGPSYISWNRDAAEIANANNKVLLEWSFDQQIYGSFPFSTIVYNEAAPPYPDLGLPMFQAWNKTLVTGKAQVGDVPYPTPKPVPNTVNSGQLNFNLNVDMTNWTTSIIDTIGPRSRSFMFIWYADYPGNLIFEEQCVQSARYVHAAGGVATFLPVHVYSQLTRELAILVAANPEVICICGPEDVFRNFVKHLEVQGTLPGTLIAAWPLRESMNWWDYDLRATWLTYSLEATGMPPPDWRRPDPVFGTLFDFVHLWWARELFNPTYEAIQVAGACSLFYAALEAVAGSFSSASLARQMLLTNTSTLLGWMSFESDGTRFVGPESFVGTRQLLPLPSDRTAGISIWNRFTRNMPRIVSKSSLDSCLGEDCESYFLESMERVNFSSWYTKLLPAYPCQPGCIVAGVECAPCPLDQFRSRMDPVCKPCLDGLYALVPGRSQCEPCPDGAKCATGQHIVPERGYCRVLPWRGSCNGAFQNYSEVKAELFASVDAAACIEDVDPMPRFLSCLPQRVCQGGEQACFQDNQGMLCGQCYANQTFQGFAAGMRKCGPCPHFWNIMLRIMLITLLYACMVTCMSSLALKAARAPGYLPTPMIRAVVHYLHMVSCVCEYTYIDSNPVFAYVLTPLDLLWRPMEVAAMDCLIEGKGEWDFGQMWLRPDVFASLMSPPAGLLFICFFHGASAGGWFFMNRVWGPIYIVIVQMTEWSERCFNCFGRFAARAADDVRKGDSKALQGLAQEAANEAANTATTAASTAATTVLQTVDTAKHTVEARANAANPLHFTMSSSLGSPSDADLSPVPASPTSPSASKSSAAARAANLVMREESDEGEELPPRRSSVLADDVVLERHGVAKKQELQLPQPSIENTASAGASPDASPAPSVRSPCMALKFTSSGTHHGDFKAAASWMSNHSVCSKGPDEGSTGEESGIRASMRSVEADEDFVRKDKFVPSDYTSIHYNQLHARRHLKKRVQDVFRELLVWLLFTYPILIRSFVKLSTCRDLAVNEKEPLEEARWINNFDLRCDEASVQWYTTRTAITVVSLPAVAMLFLFYEVTDLYSLVNRRVTSIFTSGYRPDAYFWEVIMILRTGLMIMCLKIELLTLRCVAMLFVTLGHFCMNYFFQPFENGERFALAKFDLSSQVGLMLLMVMGVVVQEERDANLGGAVLENVAAHIALETLIVGYNLVVIGMAIWQAIICPVSRQLQSIVDNGGSVSWTLNHVLHVVQYVHGMNKVLYYEDPKTGEYIIDASRLNWEERKFFTQCITDLLSACIDSSKELHTWLVRRAIHEAFLRAWRGRKAEARRLYEQRGLRPYRLGMVSCFAVQVRNPDISLYTEAAEDDDNDILTLTVEELYIALNDVNYDILEHLGPMRKAPEMRNVDLNKTTKREGFGITKWLQGEGLNTLLEELKSTGKLKRPRKKQAIADDSSSEEGEQQALGDVTRLATPPTLGDDLMLQELEREMEEHRLEEETKVERTVGEAELIDKLAKLEEEIDELAMWLSRHGNRGESDADAAAEFSKESTLVTVQGSQAVSDFGQMRALTDAQSSAPTPAESPSGPTPTDRATTAKTPMSEPAKTPAGENAKTPGNASTSSKDAAASGASTTLTPPKAVTPPKNAADIASSSSTAASNGAAKTAPASPAKTSAAAPAAPSQAPAGAAATASGNAPAAPAQSSQSGATPPKIPRGTAAPKAAPKAGAPVSPLSPQTPGLGV